MNARSIALAAASATLCAGLMLAGCSRETENKAEHAAAATGEAAQSAGNDIKQSAEVAGAKMENAAETAGAKVEQAAANAADAVADAAATATVKTELAKDAEIKALKIDVDTKGGVVTLTGTAPSAAAVTRAGDIARGVKGVTSVTNNLRVGQ